MFTNVNKYGGNFIEVLSTEFQNASNVKIATGYSSIDTIQQFQNDFLRIAENGGESKLLLGMAFYEGLSQRKHEIVSNLHNELKQRSESSGVFVANGRRFHGKVYHFTNDNISNIYVGSSNFSTSGTKGNIECTLPISSKEQETLLINFLTDIFSGEYSVPFDLAEITIPGQKKVVLNTVERLWNSLKKYDPNAISLDKLPRFIFPLQRIAEKEKSNLNVYFGKGRWNRATGKTRPRPWYEIELIANRELTEQENYPKGDFLAYTDDGLIIPMRTQGDYFKNILSRNSLQLFGIWLKGKLEKKVFLKGMSL